MKLFLSGLLKTKKNSVASSAIDKKQHLEKRNEAYFSQLGREQFKKMVDRGLGIPVAIL